MKTIQAALLIALSFFFFAVPAAASEGCYVCKSGSSNGCGQCAYGSKDTAEARKACEKRGCKIGGTAPCDTKPSAKTCMLPTSPITTAALDCASSLKVN